MVRLLTFAASLGMFGPAWRFSPQRIAAHAATVMRFAQRLSRELGYRGDYPRPAEDRS